MKSRADFYLFLQKKIIQTKTYFFNEMAIFYHVFKWTEKDRRLEGKKNVEMSDNLWWNSLWLLLSANQPRVVTSSRSFSTLREKIIEKNIIYRMIITPDPILFFLSLLCRFFLFRVHIISYDLLFLSLIHSSIL